MLECAATGYPVPVVWWKKLNGNVRVYSVSHGLSNLNFTNVHESDGGKYECQATSDGKTISRSVWLFVRGICQFVYKFVVMHWSLSYKLLLWVLY